MVADFQLLQIFVTDSYQVLNFTYILLFFRISIGNKKIFSIDVSFFDIFLKQHLTILLRSISPGMSGMILLSSKPVLRTPLMLFFLKEEARPIFFRKLELFLDIAGTETETRRSGWSVATELSVMMPAVWGWRYLRENVMTHCFTIFNVRWTYS